MSECNHCGFPKGRNGAGIRFCCRCGYALVEAGDAAPPTGDSTVFGAPVPLSPQAEWLLWNAVSAGAGVAHISKHCPNMTLGNSCSVDMLVQCAEAAMAHPEIQALLEKWHAHEMAGSTSCWEDPANTSTDQSSDTKESP